MNDYITTTFFGGSIHWESPQINLIAASYRKQGYNYCFFKTDSLGYVSAMTFERCDASTAKDLQ